jgi:hypothetical protein
MTPSAARRTSTVEWLAQPITVSGLTLAVSRLKVRLYLATTSGGPSSIVQPTWLDTGAPFSVIPFHVQQRQGPSWQPISGVQVTWSGQRCDLGRIDVWLATDQPPYLRGRFSLLAKFPRSDPPGDPIPVLLGLEFFLTHLAEFHLLSPPQQGSILLP